MSDEENEELGEGEEEEPKVPEKEVLIVKEQGALFNMPIHAIKMT